MYYLIESQYVGPNRKDSQGNRYPSGELTIETSPGVRNMSREPAIAGWLGTTNDWSLTAHGEYETLEAAQAAADDLGYTEVSESEYDDTPDVIETRVSKADAREQWDASDWLGASTSREKQLSELHITATTTDAELSTIEETLTSDARAEGIELHGLDDHLEELRTLAIEKAEEKYGDLEFIAPPECGGQIVEVAYAMLDDDGETVVVRTTDQSIAKGQPGRVVYEERELPDDEAFEPWNGAPTLR